MRLILLILAWLMAVPAAASAQAERSLATPPPAAGPQRTERIEAELVPMSAWAAPGSTAIVAIRQTIEPGWHTYWRNPGDSGGATTLAWSLPAGVAAGDILWPTPHRQRLMELVNYGYQGEVFLPVPIQIPADAPSGADLPLTVKALFLVCSDELCVPDELTLSLDLPIRAGAPPLAPEHGAAVQQQVERAPRPAGIQATASRTEQGVVLSLTGGPLAGRKPRWATFFPFRTSILDHDDPISAERGPEGLTLILNPGRAMGSGGPAEPIDGILSTDLGDWEISAAPGAPLAGASGDGAIGVVPSNAAGDAAGGVLQAMLFAFLGGLILNLMPCVFPILAMKAASLASSAHDGSKARVDGLAFTGGVLLTFLVLAGVLLGLRAAGQAVGWGFQLQSPAVTGVLALLMLAVGLNLSGVFAVGGGAQGLAGGAPTGRGPLGAALTGALAVIVAAPCTAPFMAVALGAALLMPAPLALIVFLMLGLGFALPYLAVSLSPRLLNRLPRPGPWMDRLKGLLAFPMYGAALWLAWVFSRQTSAEGQALLFASALAAGLAAWLVGTAQADRAEGRRGRVPALGAALALLASGGLMIAAAVLPPAPVEGGESASALPSEPWSAAAVQAARTAGRPVLVNFTADWCVTCKINERTSLSSPRVAQAMAEADALYLVGDWTRRDDAITAELERRGRSGVPLYLVYAPGSAEPRILPQLLTEGVVIDALETARN